MAAIMWNLLLPSHVPSECLRACCASRSRRITPDALRAMEALGHAIEYLIDEVVSKGQSLSVNNDQLETVKLLMALNRQVYLECQELPTLRERFRTFMRIK
jgi:hypothetical protein